MGERVCVQIRNKDKELPENSPVIYSHWGGEEIKDTVCYFLDKYFKKEKPNFSPSEILPHLVVCLIDHGYHPRLYNEGNEVQPDDHGWFIFYILDNGTYKVEHKTHTGDFK